MKKITLFLFLVSLSLMGFAKITPVTPSGSGTSGDPYLIGTSAEMVWFLDITGFNSYQKYYELSADIDLAPGVIGSDYTPRMATFYGTFDGKGYTISNYEIAYATATNQVGLIGNLAMGAFSNVVVKNAQVSSLGDFVGGIIGECGNGTTVNNLRIMNSTVSGDDYVGGISGRMRNTNLLESCFVYGCTVTATSTYAAGITPYAPSCHFKNIMGAYNTISAAGNYAGGLLGYIGSKIVTNGFNYGGSVSGGTHVGGVVAYGTGASVNLFSAQVSINAADQAEATANKRGSVVGTQNLNSSSYYVYDISNDQFDAIGSGPSSANPAEPASWAVSVYDLTHDGGGQNFDFGSGPITVSTRLFPLIPTFLYDAFSPSVDVQNYARLAVSPVILDASDTSYDNVTTDVILGGVNNSVFSGLTWTSSDPNILTINGQNGEVKSSGTVTLTASINGYSLAHTLTVNIPAAKWKVDIEENSLYNILTNYESVRSNDTIAVEVGAEVKAVLNLQTSDFNANLFDVIAVKKDVNGHDIFIPMTSGTNDTVIFTMPDTTVRITTLIDITSSDSIPHQLDYLELHNGASLVNTPSDGSITIDNHIMYKRSFSSSTWYSISFPFTVNRVTVLEAGVEYDILPCANSTDVNGNYYLKYIADGVAHADYASSWQFETTIQKNKAYIIAFPHSYYDGKEITFYGNAQTINDASNLFVISSDGASQSYDYHPNTSFNTQIIENPFLLNGEGTFFEKSSGNVVLNPLMCYVHSVEGGAQSSSGPNKISFNDLLNSRELPTVVDSSTEISTFDYSISGHVLTLSSAINQEVSVYTIKGQKVISLEMQEGILSEIKLVSGTYILHPQNNKSQIIIIQ